MPLLIITSSLDCKLQTTNNRDEEKKSFSVLIKLGKEPNQWQILVTLIPLHWRFSSKDTRLELDGLPKKRKDLVLPGPSSGHYKRIEERRRGCCDLLDVLSPSSGSNLDIYWCWAWGKDSCWLLAVFLFPHGFAGTVKGCIRELDQRRYNGAH